MTDTDKGIDKNGYVTDYNMLSGSNADLVSAALKVLAKHCATYGMLGSDTRKMVTTFGMLNLETSKVGIKGSTVVGKSTFEVEGGVRMLTNWAVDSYGYITFPPNPTNLG